MNEIRYSPAGQARPGPTVMLGEDAFSPSNSTEIIWLGNAGALIHSHTTNLLIDPVLSGFDMPLLIEVPITEKDLPSISGVLLTHCDNDHYSRKTCSEIEQKVKEFHAPYYVASLLKEELGISGTGHAIDEEFQIGDMKIRLTPVWHNWQNEKEKYRKLREYKKEDYCGYWIETPEGTIWAIGDSRLLPEHLNMEAPDAILFDFSDSSWHIGFENALRLAEAYPFTPLILWHWGSVDAPEWKEFNGDPNRLKEAVLNPERVIVLAPGEPYFLERLNRV